MISKNFTYAIIGASANEEKYGHRVLRDLKDAGYRVTPVNPKGGEILGLAVTESLSKMEEKPDVVVTVVPPEVTLEVIKEAIDLGIKNVWMQPGSENHEAVRLCQNAGVSCIYNACIMVQRKAIGETG